MRRRHADPVRPARRHRHRCPRHSYFELADKYHDANAADHLLTAFPTAYPTLFPTLDQHNDKTTWNETGHYY